MGGHGGLNILPQKRWNVYNFDNREKVKRDEEAAAKEEQIRREQAARSDLELRLEKLRKARGFAQVSTSKSEPEPEPELEPEPVLKPEREALWDQPREADSRHINLLEGIRFLDPVEVKAEKKMEEKKNKRARKEEPVRVVTAEDEKYKLGYGVAGKDVKLPWYMSKPEKKKRADDDDEEEEEEDYEVEFGKRKKQQVKVKKSVQELRGERLNREKKERERERALLGEKKKPRRSSGFSSGYMPSGYMSSRR